MCDAQAALILTQAGGQMMTSRNDARNQRAQRAAQISATQQTNDRQFALREAERERQRMFNQHQQQGFAQSLAAAQPDQINEAADEAIDLRRSTARSVREQTLPDAPLPGGSIPGSGGLARQATRTVGQGLERGAEQLADSTAVLQGLPAALSGLGEAFAPGAQQIGIAGDASQRSRALLPAELDAARIAPKFPAPRSNFLGQILSGGANVGLQALGVREGQREAAAAAQRQQQDQQNEVLRQLFNLGLSNAPFRPGAPPITGGG